MIIEPDFFGHWKTAMLVGLTQEEASPLYIIRLWVYCHQRMAWKFENMTPEKLKAICRWKGDAEVIWKHLQDCEFVRFEDGQFVVHDWDTTNKTLVRNWKNGPKGGRPKGTQTEPTENPDGTQTEPRPNPQVTDKNRIEGNRREERKKKEKKKAAASPALEFEELVKTERFAALDTLEFRTAYLSFLNYRISSGKKTTRRAVELHLIDALKTGADVAVLMMADCEKNGWTGWYWADRVEEYRRKSNAVEAEQKKNKVIRWYMPEGVAQ